MNHRHSQKRKADPRRRPSLPRFMNGFGDGALLVRLNALAVAQDTKYRCTESR